MTFCISDVQQLIAAAGGEYRLGMKMKKYLWHLCEDLVMVTNVSIQPRTLERAWREGELSDRVRSALETLAIKRAYNGELQCIKDIEKMLDKYEFFFPDNPPPMVPYIRTLLPWIRSVVSRRYRNVLAERCLNLAEAIERDRAGEVA